MKTYLKILILSSIVLFLTQTTLFYFGYSPDREWMKRMYFLCEKYYTFGFAFFSYSILPPKYYNVIKLLGLNLKEMLLFVSTICVGRFMYVVFYNLGFVGITDEMVSYYFIIVGIGIFTCFLVRKYFLSSKIRKK